MAFRALTPGGRAAFALILASIYFLAAALGAHFVNSQYDFYRDYISDYAVGPRGRIYGCQQERGDALSGVLSEIFARLTFGVVEQVLMPPEWRASDGLGLKATLACSCAPTRSIRAEKVITVVWSDLNPRRPNAAEQRHTD